MRRLLNIVFYLQLIVYASTLLILVMLYSSPSSYTDFEISPPTLYDKIWYVSEAIIYATSVITFACIDFFLYQTLRANKWARMFLFQMFLGIFFVVRLICETIWVITGISINSKYMAITLFCTLISAIICTVFLKQLDRILKLNLWD